VSIYRLPKLVTKFSVCVNFLEGLERDYVGHGLRHRPPSEENHHQVRCLCELCFVPSEKQVRSSDNTSCSHSPPFSQIILALLQSGDAYLVDLRKKYRGRVELEEVQDDSDEESGASSRYAFPLLPFSSCKYSAYDRSAMTVAQFDPTGRHIFVGTSTGSILVFNTRTKTVSPALVLPLWMTKLVEQMVARHKIPGAGVMKGLDFAKSGR
jgi:hypothetical protein